MAKCDIQLAAVAAPRSWTAGGSRIYIRVRKHAHAASADVACFPHETRELTLHRQVVGLKIPSSEVQWHCGSARTIRKRNRSRADVRQRNRGYTSYEPRIRSKRLSGQARSGANPPGLKSEIVTAGKAFRRNRKLLGSVPMPYPARTTALLITR